jgi:hypothetical protein
MKAKIITAVINTALILTLFVQSKAFAQQTFQATTVKPADVSGDLLDMRNTNDDRMDTRAYSGKKNYVGMSFTIDLGSERPVIGVSQDHGRWPTHYPGAYRVEVAANASGPWLKAWEGDGVRGESKAKFPAILARYIRVTATAVNQSFKEEWSIAEIRGGIDPGQKPRTIPNPTPSPTPNPPNGNPGPVPPVINKQLQPAAALDGNLETFSTSGTPDYVGMYYILDLGGEYELSRVIQNHGAKAEDYPAEYKIEVSRARNEGQYREVWRGNGQASRSTARFDPVVTRFVRITALRKRDNTHWWSIAELRTNRDPETIDRDEDNLTPRPIRAITAQGLSNINAVIDDSNTTKAATLNANYLGSWVNVDLGGSYTVSRIVQIHDPDDRDFPARYHIEASADGSRWQRVFEGQGERGRSIADFTPVRARYLRITATDNRNNRPWTIYKLKVRG